MAYSPCPGLPAVVVSENFGNKLTFEEERKGERGWEGGKERETEKGAREREREKGEREKIGGTDRTTPR